MKFIKNSANDRIFCDAMIRKIAVETLLSGTLDATDTLASYSKYDYEFYNGRHGGYRFVEIGEKVKGKDLEKLQEIVAEGHEKRLSNINELRSFLAEKLNINDDYLHCLNESNHLEYTFNIANSQPPFANSQCQISNVKS